MSTTQTYISKVISFAVILASSFPAVAETKSMELVSVNTISDISISERISSKQVKTNSSYPNYFVVESTSRLVPDAFPIPKTEIGRKLLEYRRAALAKGMKILSVEEIDVMILEGRGATA